MTSHPGDCDASNSAAASVVATDFDTGYLNAADAAALDEELMSTPGFTLEQLMELAGLAVAEAVYQVLNEEEDDPQQTKGAVPSVEPQSQRILVICGPGNNGGDGLVAARHLVMFGYEATVVYPKRSRTQLHYANLVKQCQDLNIPVLDEMPDNWSSDHAVIVDAIFGFSFHGEPRPPFDRILEQLKSLSAMNDKILTVAVDVPSGWSVDGDDDGAVSETKFVPDVLVSLTAPKLCAQHFPGRHFVGGRFLPPALAAKYNVKMPPYHKTNQVMEISSRSSSSK